MAETAAAPKNVKFIITRQDEPETSPYTEEFELAYRPGMNVISALMEIQRNPVNAKAIIRFPYAGNPTVWKRSAVLAPWSSTASPVRPAQR